MALGLGGPKVGLEQSRVASGVRSPIKSKGFNSSLQLGVQSDGA